MKLLTPDRYEKGRPRLLAGLMRRHPFSESGGGIADQWREFQCIGEIPSQLGRTAYGVMGGHADEGFVYICAVEVESFDNLAEHFGRRHIAAEDYAVFEHRGSTTTLRSTWEGIFEWLAQSTAYESAHKPDFEVYENALGPLAGDGVVEIWIAILPKSDRSRHRPTD